MTIVCTTDFSQPADDALAVAVDIALKRREALFLWHSVLPQLGDPDDPYVEPLRVECEARLRDEAERLRALGLTVASEVVVGWPDDQLPQRMPADTTLIVAGARGHARGTHWLIGTVVERLARVVTVPMLVVREAGTLRSWLDGSRRLNVIVTTDLSAVSDFALRRAKLLSDLGACNVEILYVEYPPSEYARLGVTGPICVHKPHPLIDDVLSRELSRRANAIDLGGTVQTRIAKTLGSTGALIAIEADAAHADLVVVGSHQRRGVPRLWHGSIAHGVLHSAETNVLLIPFHTADENLRALEPSPMKIILAATDFSPCGNRAVAWACSMARPSTRVVIVNVVPDESESEKGSCSLERVKAAVTRSGGGTIETMVAVGKDVAATICSTAERIATDVVIVGRHTRSRIEHALGGSVSTDVLARSRRPVLVVPDPATI